MVGAGAVGAVVAAGAGAALRVGAGEGGAGVLAVEGAGAVGGAVGVAVVDGDGDGVVTVLVATAGTAVLRSPKDSRAAHRSRTGEGKVTGFSSRIRASARWLNSRADYSSVTYVTNVSEVKPES